jgi:plasmid rolling circle replication initiator protein Rep
MKFGPSMKKPASLGGLPVGGPSGFSRIGSDVMDDKQQAQGGQAETKNRYFKTTGIKRVTSSEPRRGKAKRQNSSVSEYLQAIGETGLSARLARCAETLYEFDRMGGKVYRRDPESICELPRLCQCCGLAHSSELFGKFKPALDRLVLERPTLDGHFVTLTVQDHPDLLTALDNLDRALGLFQVNFRNRRRRRNALEFCEGGVFSIEVKRGENSGAWHPHVHGVLFFDRRPDYDGLRKLWNNSTRQESASNCFKWIRKKVDGTFDAKAVCEIFKYSIKFQDLPPADQYEAFLRTRKRALLRRFGCLRGVELGGEFRESVDLLRSVHVWNPQANDYEKNEVTDVLIHDFQRPQSIMPMVQHGVAPAEVVGSKRRKTG